MNRSLSERHPTIRCKAHSSRTGEPCKRWASVGSTVCSTHGASAPQVKKTATHIKQTAEERIQALVPKAIARIEALIDGAENETVALNASKDMLDRAGLKAPEKVDATLQVEIDPHERLASRIAQLSTRLTAAGVPRQPET